MKQNTTKSSTQLKLAMRRVKKSIESSISSANEDQRVSSSLFRRVKRSLSKKKRKKSIQPKIDVNSKDCKKMVSKQTEGFLGVPGQRSGDQ